jgi:hypothetical protein
VSDGHKMNTNKNNDDSIKAKMPLLFFRKFKVCFCKNERERATWHKNEAD